MGWAFSVALALQQILYFALRPIFNFIYRKKPPSIPPITNPLLKLSATTLAKKIREGEISSEAVVEAYIKRIKEVNPFLNAVIDDRFEAALNDAKNCDEKLKSKEVTILTLEKEKPLYGVPFTVKESCSLKGLSYTGCSLVRKGTKAPADSFVVECLRNAGGIPLCVTNTPELCSTFNTANFVYGETSNPYDTRYTAGGSTGGEGALLGAGASVIGVGSDIAGSIRIPAHFNGIFGHKPTPGIIPIDGHYPMSDNGNFRKYLVLGPMSRYAEDLHLATKIMSAKCGRDLRLDEPVDMENLKVLYTDNLKSVFGRGAPTPDVMQVVKRATDYLTERGAISEQIPESTFDDFVSAFIAVFFAKAGIPPLLLNSIDPKNPKKPLCELVKGTFGLSQYTKAASYMNLLIDLKALTSASSLPYYENLMENTQQKFNSWLKDNAVFIFPTFPCAAIHKHLVSLRLDGSLFAIFANVLQLPSTHVPMGLNKQGLPVGLQVIAAPHQDRLGLAVAKELEKRFGGWIPPSSELMH